MATIIKKTKKGRLYYYAVESKRVNGKPRIVWQKYLGTLDSIVKRTELCSPAKPKQAVIFEAGGVAGLVDGNEIWDTPFARMETVDHRGNQIISWQEASNIGKMTVSKHGLTCTYDFSNPKSFFFFLFIFTLFLGYCNI